MLYKTGNMIEKDKPQVHHCPRRVQGRLICHYGNGSGIPNAAAINLRGDHRCWHYGLMYERWVDRKLCTESLLPRNWYSLPGGRLRASYRTFNSIFLSFLHNFIFYFLFFLKIRVLECDKLHRREVVSGFIAL
jgi:hypothetical protein